MSRDNLYLDFDANKPEEIKKLMHNAYRIAHTAQQPRNLQYMRDYKNYHCIYSMLNRDPRKAHIFVPKIFVAVQTKIALNVRGTIGTMPYIPFESRNEDFSDQSEMLSQMLEYYLSLSNFEDQYEQSAKLKIAYGTSFIEPMPYYEIVDEDVPVTNEANGEPENRVRQQRYLRFRLKTYAPWEVYVDPFAKNLETKHGCRYVIKLDLMSRREIIQAHEEGMYSDLDIDELRDRDARGSEFTEEHVGKQILSEMGLPLPEQDDDMGMVMRLESPDHIGRWIDFWNGETLLANETSSPFDHGMINLSRHTHTSDIHPQNSFWGIGDCKIAEGLQHAQNDMINMAVNSHMVINNPVTYYKKNAVNRNHLIRVAGNKIAISSDGDRPLSHYIQDAEMTNLPRDHYMMPDMFSRMIDQALKIYDVQKGEDASRGATATEFAMRQAAGDIQQELEIKKSEFFLGDLGKKMLYTMNQFATRLDKAEILGQEGSQRLLSTNPQDIPGGWNFTFVGSSRAANKFIMQRNIKEALPMIMNFPNLMPGAILKYILELFDIPRRVIEKSVVPDQIMQMLQRQKEAQASQQANAEASFNARTEDARKIRLEREKANIKQNAQGSSTGQINDNQGVALSNAGASTP